MESRTYQLPDGVTVEQVARGVEGFLRNEKQLVVEGTATSQGYCIRARTEQSGWKTISGMDKAVQVQISGSGLTMSVQLGTGDWTSKIGAGAAGLFLFAPLAVTAGIGAYQQGQLPKEILAFSERFLAAGGRTYEVGQGSLVGGYPANGYPAGSRLCSGCGVANPAGARFCSECGTKLD